MFSTKYFHTYKNTFKVFQELLRGVKGGENSSWENLTSQKKDYTSIKMSVVWLSGVPGQD